MKRFWMLQRQNFLIKGLSEEHMEVLLNNRYHTVMQVYDEETNELAYLLEISEEEAQVIIDNAATALDELTAEDLANKETK